MNGWHQLTALLDDAPGDYSVCVTTATGRQLFGYAEQTIRSSASLIKVPLAMAVIDAQQPSHPAYVQADSTIGLLSNEPNPLTNLVYVREADRVEGGGRLDIKADGTTQPLPNQVSIRDLLTYTLTMSDNTAANALVDIVGFAGVNRLMSYLGLQTQMRRKFMDYDALHAGRDNTTSAADMCAIFSCLLQPRYIELLNLLRQAVGDGKLEAGLPTGTTLAHKVGDLPNVEHDAGIIFGQGEPYVVAALAVNLPSVEVGRQTIAAASRLIWQQMSEHHERAS